MGPDANVVMSAEERLAKLNELVPVTGESLALQAFELPSVQLIISRVTSPDPFFEVIVGPRSGTDERRATYYFNSQGHLESADEFTGPSAAKTVNNPRSPDHLIARAHASNRIAIP